MSKTQASRMLLSFFMLMFLNSCATGGKEVRTPIPVEWDKSTVSYPKYRIDNKVQRLSIIGSGEGTNTTANYLTKMFMETTNVKVVEPGDFQAILGGKIIKYSTGLTAADSQALSQMLQIDHIVLFEEKLSPYRDYQYGGRKSLTINLKILNTLNGEVVYQATHSFGGNMPDPRIFGYPSINKMSTFELELLHEACFVILSHELSYAMGNYILGWRYKNENGLIVDNILPNSVVDKAGIKTNDNILEYSGVKVQGVNDLLRRMKQGDDVRVKVIREGKILEFNLKIPAIPFMPEEKKKKN
jgi:hypothetical protein